MELSVIKLVSDKILQVSLHLLCNHYNIDSSVGRTVPKIYPNIRATTSLRIIELTTTKIITICLFKRQETVAATLKAL